MLKHLTQWQKKMSIAFNNRFMPADMLKFGTYYFDTHLIDEYLAQNQTIYDIGGGKHPNISHETKKRYNLHIVGVDIDADELAAAPAGLYDEEIVADITVFEGKERADLVICRSAMEHIDDTAAALSNIAQLTRPGGYILIFTPCKNAWFAILNRFLPEKIKQKLLDYSDQDKRERLGFPAHYNNCTPPHFKARAKNYGLVVKSCQIFWQSRYFEAFTPIHIIWRLYQLGVRYLKIERLCETFTIVYKRQNG